MGKNLKFSWKVIFKNVNWVTEILSLLKMSGKQRKLFFSRSAKPKPESERWTGKINQNVYKPGTGIFRKNRNGTGMFLKNRNGTKTFWKTRNGTGMFQKNRNGTKMFWKNRNGTGTGMFWKNRNRNGTGNRKKRVFAPLFFSQGHVSGKYLFIGWKITNNHEKFEIFAKVDFTRFAAPSTLKIGNKY